MSSVSWPGSARVRRPNGSISRSCADSSPGDLSTNSFGVTPQRGFRCPRSRDVCLGRSPLRRLAGPLRGRLTPGPGWCSVSAFRSAYGYPKWPVSSSGMSTGDTTLCTCARAKAGRTDGSPCRVRHGKRSWPISGVHRSALDHSFVPMSTPAEVSPGATSRGASASGCALRVCVARPIRCATAERRTWPTRALLSGNCRRFLAMNTFSPLRSTRAVPALSRCAGQWALVGMVVTRNSPSGLSKDHASAPYSRRAGRASDREPEGRNRW